MPAYPKGTFTYTGGIDGQSFSIMGGWSVTLTHGMTPLPIRVRVPFGSSGKPPSKNGDVILKWGNTKITLKKCTIDYISQDVLGERFWNISLLDRRYLWKDTPVNGFYNVRFRNGTDVREETKKTPTKLAKICLQKMGETGYDITALKKFDNLDWPEINWDNVNAAEALTALCELYEMRPIFDWAKDRVVVVVVGKGAELRTDLPYTQYSGTYDPPEKPGKLIVQGSPSLVQYDFPLEAVAKDVDGKLKPPDKVSYIPNPPQAPPNAQGPDLSSGTYADEGWLPWAGIDRGFYNITVPYLRQLAQESILRIYRIVPPKRMQGLFKIAGDREDAVTLGDFGSISEDENRSWLWQIALQGDQNDRLTTLADPLNTQFDEYNKEVSQSQLPAWVYGQYAGEWHNSNVVPDLYTTDENQESVLLPLSGLKKINPSLVFSPAQQNASTLPSEDTPAVLEEKVRETGFYTGGFSIDSDRGLVYFSEPVYQWMAPKDSRISFKNANGTPIYDGLERCRFPATLWLRARFFVRDKDTREPIRYQKTRVLDPDVDTVRVIRRDDLVFKLTYRFVGPCSTDSYPPTFDPSTTEDNKSAIDEAMDAYLDQIVDEYENRQPQTIVHPGFISYTLDGAIRQVTWMVDGGGKAWTRASRDREELHIVRDYADRRLAERLRTIAQSQTQRATDAEKVAAEGAAVWARFKATGAI